MGRQRLAFEHATEEDGTEITIVECWVDPGGGVPPHIHPNQTEVFEVIEGEMTFTAGRGRKAVPAGESIEVPPGTRHGYENRSTGTVYMRCTARPGLDLESFLVETARLGRAGHVRRVGPLRGPGSLRGLPQVARLLRDHRENTVILFPPPAVQRLLLDPLAKRA